MNNFEWLVDFYHRQKPYITDGFDRSACESSLQRGYSLGFVLDTALNAARKNNRLSPQDAERAVAIMLYEPDGDFCRLVPAWQGLIDQVTTKQAA